MKPGRQYLSFYDMQHIQQIRKDSVPQELCPPPVDERERTESVYTLTVEGSGCSRIVQFPSTLELQINSVQRVWRQWETCFTSRHDSDQLKYLLPWHTFATLSEAELGVPLAQFAVGERVRQLHWKNHSYVQTELHFQTSQAQKVENNKHFRIPQDISDRTFCTMHSREEAQWRGKVGRWLRVSEFA